ncbi:NfeD family protein [Clostridium sardiniense]|uniref:NfeD family protein n=1 Tax=Clostridium sardiniense TaxID=29369 RepID=UPI003D324918
MLLTCLWIIVAIAMVGIDLATSAFLFSWIGLGALVAMFANLFELSFLVQVILFGAVSLIAIGIGYPWAKKKFKASIRTTPLMEETYIGMIFDSGEKIEEAAQIKVSGIYWAAINEGEIIEKGDKFIITGIQGNKFTINKYKGED